MELHADSDMDYNSDKDVHMEQPLQRSDTDVSCNGQHALVGTPWDAPHTMCNVCLAHSSPECMCNYCDRLCASNACICNMCGRIHYVHPCNVD